jgi:[acyl-carrier-protein] S-malonyltransferase
MPSTALLFPGQGSHAEGMDDPWREHPLMARGIEVLGFDPFARLHEGTAMQQPALLLCSLCAWAHEGWDEPEAPASAAAGHSLGEYSALVAAGALAFDDAVALVAERGAAMDEAARLQAGGMLALLGGEDHAVRGLATRFGLTIANDNAPGQLVLSGADDAIAGAERVARDETGARARRLDVAGAFHSPLMAPAAERLAAALDRTPFAPPRLPVYANATAAPFTDPRRELAEHLLQPVRWRETLLALRAAGMERFVELGPGAVLTGLVKRTLGIRGEVPA